ncbi:hypothetical protein CANARDRAFT_27850 [[Candida] arabinofermentans NRRL YB-2248]|uniref:Vacuolar import/degradation Vid27 C-terminal domain-containing protein n=1 Tax=[Candida] arabinofermentans NRRL YB-2248 TaxID=983967 RepID=A0A1E4T241_9ASCO|nr:hypothetical protein CANARDRAFT_27850 [[Candida] arabinofermentans NRRL YB-2248]
MNIIKKLFLNNSPHSKDELILIPSGQLFLIRSPTSPKSENECLYSEVVATIKETTQPFCYQLVINKLGSEEQDPLGGDDSDDGNDEEELFESESNSLKSFLIVEELKFCLSRKYDKHIIAWKDVDGDFGDMFELRIAPSVNIDTINQFMTAIYKCEYEYKYSKPSLDLTLTDLKEFIVSRDAVFDNEPGLLSSLTSSSEYVIAPETPKSSKVRAVTVESESDEEVYEDAAETGSTDVEGTVLVEAKGSVYLYDPVDRQFKLQQPQCLLSITDLKNYDYWMDIKHAKTHKTIVASYIEQINPSFNYEEKSMDFYYVTEKDALVWRAVFKTAESFAEFHRVAAKALWQQKNKQPWEKLTDIDQEYMIDSFGDLKLADEDMQVEDGDDDFFSADDFESETDSKPLKQSYKNQKLFVDSDSDDDEDIAHSALRQRFKKSSAHNQGLKVGYKDFNTFIPRGDRIGVFREDSDSDDLEFTNAIENITSSKDKKKKLSPTNLMLLDGDSKMVFQNKGDINKMHLMDLEYGKVVEEWGIQEKGVSVPVVNYAPRSKLAERTGEQTFLGLSHQQLFVVDPRLQEKIVPGEQKSYKTKVDFTHLATTEDGYTVVANSKGELKLYNKINMNAKTALPGLGDKVIGLETSGDGRYVLATCQDYLLLIDTKIRDGKYQGSSGFERSFSKDSKPLPKKLKLQPQHYALIKKTAKDASFTKATFNISLNSRSKRPVTITTTVGPYVIVWSLAKVLKNERDTYTITKYHENVLESAFTATSSKKVILASADDVGLVNRRAFKTPEVALNVVEEYE